MWRMLLVSLLIVAADSGSAQSSDPMAQTVDGSLSPEDTGPLPYGVASSASLGIGFDVFPRAFEFAAGRVGTPSDLNILSCKEERCNYSLGSYVMVSADHLPKSMDLNRIEASLDARHSREPAVRLQFEQACLTIVALVDPRASRDVQQATANAISASSSGPLRRFRVSEPEKGVRVYGLSADGTAASAIALRCGAVAGL